MADARPLVATNGTMVRESDDAYAPSDVDFYYHDRIEGVWQGVHACMWVEDGDDGAFESECRQVQADVSDVDGDATYESLAALEACDCSPCYVCRDAGAFDP